MILLLVWQWLRSLGTFSAWHGSYHYWLLMFFVLNYFVSVANLVFCRLLPLLVATNTCYYSPWSREVKYLVASVCLPSVCSHCWTVDLDFWHKCWPWPWQGFDSRSRSKSNWLNVFWHHYLSPFTLLVKFKDWRQMSEGERSVFGAQQAECGKREFPSGLEKKRTNASLDFDCVSVIRGLMGIISRMQSIGFLIQGLMIHRWWSCIHREVPSIKDSMDQCLMPIKADQNHGIDPKFHSMPINLVYLLIH